MPAPNFLQRSSACTTKGVVNDVGCVLPTSHAKRCCINSPGLWALKTGARIAGQLLKCPRERRSKGRNLNEILNSTNPNEGRKGGTKAPKAEDGRPESRQGGSRRCPRAPAAGWVRGPTQGSPRAAQPRRPPAPRHSQNRGNPPLPPGCTLLQPPAVPLWFFLRVVRRWSQTTAPCPLSECARAAAACSASDRPPDGPSFWLPPRAVGGQGLGCLPLPGWEGTWVSVQLLSPPDPFL